MVVPYTEKKCVIEHEGKKFEACGAAVTDDHIVAYVGGPIFAWDHSGLLNLTDWHGTRLGSCRMDKGWLVKGTRIHQITARVQGVVYTGRGQGEGMVFVGKRRKGKAIR